MNDQILTHEQALALLSEKARAGSITAAVALERALRLSGRHEEEIDDALDRLLSEAPVDEGRSGTPGNSHSAP